MNKKKQELLFVDSGDKAMSYNWAVGREGSKFLRELRDNKKIFGMRCSQCGKVYITPRGMCGPCFKPINEWVELGTEGTLEAFSVINYDFVDPNTGKSRPIPYTYGYIKLDGADTMLSHIINETNPENLRAGMRVKAIFAVERHGSLEDIEYFEPVNQE